MCNRHVHWPDSAVTDHLSQKRVLFRTGSYLSCLTHVLVHAHGWTSPPAGAWVDQLDLLLVQPHATNAGGYLSLYPPIYLSIYIVINIYIYIFIFITSLGLQDKCERWTKQGHNAQVFDSQLWWFADPQFNSNLKVLGSDMAAAEQKQLLQHFDLLIPGKVDAI